MRHRERVEAGNVLRSVPGWFPLSAVGAATLVAAVVGIQLGNSAIGEINPIYYRGPAPHPRDRGAAIDERELQARLARHIPDYAESYGWEEGMTARHLECEDCTGRPRIYQAAVPYFGSFEESRAEEAAERREADRRYEARLAEAAEREVRSKDVLRYATFPLTEDEAGPAELETSDEESLPIDE